MYEAPLTQKSLFYKPKNFLLVSAAISHDQLNISKIWELFPPHMKLPSMHFFFLLNDWISPVKFLQSNYKCDYL